MENGYKKPFTDLVRKHKRYASHADTDLLFRAFDFSFESHKDQLRKSGKPYFEHCFEVAKILTELKMDSTTIASGLLHDVAEDTGCTIAEVEEHFGADVALLVDGVTKISELRFDSMEERQAENFRKMIISMVKDIRVIMIKFADRLHNMRTLEYLPKKKQERIAKETRDVYAPLAHRLGIAKVKWELEDLILKTLEPDSYRKLVKKVADKIALRVELLNQDGIEICVKRESIHGHEKVAGWRHGDAGALLEFGFRGDEPQDHAAGIRPGGVQNLTGRQNHRQTHLSRPDIVTTD